MEAKEDKGTKRVQLLIDAGVYEQVQDEAWKSRCSANAWMRDAIVSRLEGVPGDAMDAQLKRLWDGMEPEGQELLLQHARLILNVPSMRRAGFKEPVGEKPSL